MLTLTDCQAFAWRDALKNHEALRNLTYIHVKVAHVLAGLIGDGHACPAQADIAALARCGVSTAKDALRRLRALGLIGWKACFQGGPKSRRPNRYWLVLPLEPAVARPDLRRHRLAGVRRASKEERFCQERDAPGDRSDAVAALAARRRAVESSRTRAWQARFGVFAAHPT